MKIQFCVNYSENAIAEFDVAEAPTDEQCKTIEDEIATAIDKWEEENDDFSEFDCWQVCHDVCEKHLKLIDNPVIRTLYI